MGIDKCWNATQDMHGSMVPAVDDGTSTVASRDDSHEARQTGQARGSICRH